MICMMALLPLSASAAIIEDFESQTADSTTPPSGWSLVTVAGTGSYKTTSAGQGSNGSGGSAGLAGQVSADAFVGTNLPGAYLVNSFVFDVTQAINGSFDVYAVQEGTSDDVAMVFGNIGSGFAGATAGDFLSAKFLEGTGDDALADSNNVTLANYFTTGFEDDTWYHATFSWTPTSGTTGDFSITLTDFGATTVSTMSTTGYTFNSSSAQFGFGSVNDTIRFDNVNIAAIPEPSTLCLVGLAALGLIGLGRRRVL